MTMVWGDLNEAVDIELELYIAIECELPGRSPKDVRDDAMSLRLTSCFIMHLGAFNFLAYLINNRFFYY